MEITAKHIRYIKERLEKSKNVSIYFPKATDENIETLSQTFKVTKDPFGYVCFEPLERKKE